MSSKSTRKSSRRLSIQSMEIPINFMKRKRKRPDDDAVSITSMDMGEGDANPSTSKKSKKHAISRASSLIDLLSPRKSRTLRSSSFKAPDGTPSTPKPVPYRPPGPTPTKRRLTMTWTDSMAGANHVQHMSQQLIKHQEAIYELYQSEKDIASDLSNVKKMYWESMVTLSLITSEEASQIFGPTDQLIPVHEDLVVRLEQQRQRDGTTQGVGQQILDWIPQLEVYVGFCSNQPFAKSMLDDKQQVPAIRDYLARCQECPQSRKLDLWALLDGARGRFVKYPLLLKAILKETPEDHEDVELLKTALSQLDAIIKQADDMTGRSECQLHKSRLRYTFDDQKIMEIEESNALILQGPLRNTKNNKVQLYLFEKAVVVTQPNSHQVLRQPIPVSQLVVEDLADGEVSKMGSFRSALTQGQSSKNVFRLSFTDPSQGQSHTLIAADEHSKQQWMRSFQTLTNHIVHRDSIKSCSKKGSALSRKGSTASNKK
ncbi:neuroepithelial cell-transforming gene 1 protein-like [Babylonia areolata]|uniref:neuroepithelial cell-transforming gene 1 protein-like n=1 Tax=Babylonia areolata TaxID=304850 RepID=UPI003FD3A7F0